MLLIISFVALLAAIARSATHSRVVRRRSTVACVVLFIILSIGVAIYVGFELVVGCNRGDSEYVDGQWRLWPLGNHCEFPATDVLPAETTGAGWGVSAAALMIFLLGVLWIADAVKILKKLQNERTAIRTSID